MDIFNNLCRSCNIEKQQMLNIFTTKEFNHSISIKEMLEYCLQTTITKDNKYPQCICYDCIKQLEISYRFLKRFNLAQKEFEEVYTRLEKSCDDFSDDCTAEDNAAEKIEVFDGNLVHAYDDSNSQTEHIQLNDAKVKPYDNNLLSNTHKPIVIIPATKTSINSTAGNIAPSPDNVPAIICSLCNKTFYTTKALNLHQKLSHKRKI